MTESPGWQEPAATLMDMLLTEPGSRVEGDTEDVLRVMYAVIQDAGMARGMSEVDADDLALFVLPRLHAVLAQQGHIVRDYAGE